MKAVNMENSFDVVVIGASAGGVHTLPTILAPLPRDFPVPIVVVQHLAPNIPSCLASVLARDTALLVQSAESGLVMRPGSVYVAPPNQHVLVGDGGRLMLSDQPKVHYVRPSVSVLFESVAAKYGPRAIGVILSGTGKDGSEGVRAVKNAGGRIIVQDRLTALFFDMPLSAIATGCYDFILPDNKIASALLTLTMVPIGADIFRVVTPLAYYAQ